MGGFSFKIFFSSELEGGLAVYEDMGILPIYSVQVLPQNRFLAHSVYQRYLHAGQLNITGIRSTPSGWR